MAGIRQGAANTIPSGSRTVVAATTNSIPTIPFTIQPLSDYVRWLKILIYGDYGSGKTRLAGSAVMVPNMRDVLFIDCEAGDLTIATEPEFHDVAIKHMDVISVKTFSTLARIQEFLRAHCTYRDADNTQGLKQLEEKLMGSNYNPDTPPRTYRTAIIDSLTEAETYSMYQLLGVTDKTRLDEETASPEWAEYKKNYSQILRLIRKFRDLPMHIIFTSGATYVQDDQKRMLWQPSLSGKLAKQCQGFMDVVTFAQVGQGENGKKVHTFQAQPSSKINAKCRFSNFKEMGWNNPTMQTILDSVGLDGS